jgi:hypothetical protein
MDHSIPIKRSEAGLKSLVLWGRLLARNGKVTYQFTMQLHNMCCCSTSQRQHRKHRTLPSAAEASCCSPQMQLSNSMFYDICLISKR